MISVCSKKLWRTSKANTENNQNTFTESKFYGRNNVCGKNKENLFFIETVLLYFVQCCIRCEEIMTTEKVERKQG